MDIEISLRGNATVIGNEIADEWNEW